MKPQTEFKKSDAVGDCFSLWVNGEETNVYYFTPKYQHYDMCPKDEMQNAIIIQILIEQEMIKPAKGESWKMFDLCAHCDVMPESVQEITEPGNYKNAIEHLTGYSLPNKGEVIAKLSKGIRFTQYCKRLVNGGISKKVGVVFGQYGYSAYFI